MYTVLFWIFFTINVGRIGAYFVHFHGCLKKDVYSRNINLLNLQMGEVKQINIKN